MRSSASEPPSAAPAPFNPLTALQSLLSADVMSVRQRIKAAQQLEEYFRLLPPTPGLLLSYELYLLPLTAVMVTPVKGGQELQTTVLAMMQTLSTHNPTGFSDWIARNAQMGNEPWLVQWSYTLLLQTEKIVPRGGEEGMVWDETTPEFKEFDRVFARVLNMWRTLLDHTGDVALVDQLVKYLQALLMMQTGEELKQWRTMMLKKLQTHFVDIADVLIGWMMSTGPNSPLREEILTLLHHFGRLWADNSVFSLQLLNSFADEIVNLCDSWNDHQEGDGDRLSTLLTCFMMVAQCVPGLGLPADEGAESPFERVLYRVASCPQPEYSLFCLANCSECLVSMSNSSHNTFAPLSVTAVRFLLYHCAVQSRRHDSDIDKISTVLENACKLARANFPRIDNWLQVRPVAIGVLEDDIPSRIIKKGGQSKRIKVMECLFHLRCANSVTYMTQLCLQLVCLGGIGALKALGTRALQRLNGRSGGKGNSSFVFAATCFILASRNPDKLRLADDDDVPQTVAILELITARLEKQNHQHRQHKLSPRQLCLMLKMASAFIDAVSRWFAGREDAVENVNGVLLRVLECAISMLPNEVVVVRDHRLGAQILKVIDGVLSQAALVSLIPWEFCRDLVTGVARATRSSSAKVRELSVQVLETFHSRAEAGGCAGELFELSLDLLLDPSHVVQRRIMSVGLSSLARCALLRREKLCTPRHMDLAAHPSFVGADLENIMNLFQSRECDESKWYRACRRIMDRITPDVPLGNSDILLGAIHQAAAWCIQNRLRTHFGGPAQSFASIEQLLQEYANDHRWQQTNDDPENSRSKPSHQLMNWLMLEFVSELEMRITRAICITGVDQSDPDSEEYKSLIFFRTNKVVCDDWLNRIRPFLVEVSKNGSSYELYRYHSHALMMTCYGKLNRTMAACASRGATEQLSNELRQAENALDIALYTLCRCHSDAKDADSIVGLQRWGEAVSSASYKLSKGNIDIGEEQRGMPLFRWLNAVRYEAEMRYEDATAEYESLLQPVLSQGNSQHNSAAIFASPMTYLRISSTTLLGCIKQCARCYGAMHEWGKLRQFVTLFIEVAKSLADYDYPIEGIQAIFDYSDLWSVELKTVCSLETGVTTIDKIGNGIKGDQTTRAALALRVWSITSESDTRWANAASNADDLASQVRNALVPLALQPSPWIGYVGEKVGKRAEEILLRMAGLSKKAQLVTGIDHAEALVDVLRLNPELYDSVIYSQQFSTPAMSCSESADSDCLHLTRVARLARKQHNFGLARSLLRNADGINGVRSVLSMAVSYEKAKVLEMVGMEDEGRRILEAQCETSLESIGLNPKHSGEASVTVRLLLRLATTYAKADISDLVTSAASGFLQRPLMASMNFSNEEVRDIDFSSDLQAESAYKCLQTAITVSPASAKAWIRYSHWCYDRGKFEMEHITEQNGYIHLDPSDESEMNSLLEELGVTEPDRNPLIRAFCHFLENGELISTRLEDFHQLCSDRAPPDHNADAVDRLIQLQRACHSKVLRFHKLSARGYGKYLSVLLNDSGSSAPREELIMVALRLLGLLTNYGAEREIVSVLEEVFSNGPVMPWSFVVPQLIARAHHPVADVSSLVCLILKRLAHHSPHAIVYPAVVDSMEPQTTFTNLREERGTASNTFATVLQELQNVSSGQVEGVRLLISELRRISILWDEAWISTLVKLSADVSRRTSTLEKEAARVDKNVSLSAKEKSELAQRKMLAIMKPIYVSIERLWKETCGSVRDQHTVSPNERKFLKEYGGLIEKATQNFRDCCNPDLRVSLAPGVMDPQDFWQPFDEVLKLLMNATGRREHLPLHDISPAMASTVRQLALTNMPGAISGNASGHTEPVTIHRVDSSVAILRTKTKPKSLEFIGSDGETYKYLLKAREDLRLDERIMQFLRVTNDFLRADNAAAARDLSAQSYSVIPISRNAGLIQMVPDVVPLFQVYTARNDGSGRALQDPASASSALQQPPPPTAQFYAKLKQHGITNVSPSHRAQWPAPVLKQVYQELVAQRPRNVLQQEILLRSDNLRESWTKSARLSKSLAVMSVLGYIVGLGDRHLDNILLCINSGDIVHIDHNVCFDKGRKLKVPEIVPFRLTPMLQDALGFTGVEGRFRVAFETTLRVVRSDYVREALLTLLEAFVYNPLADWIVEDKRQDRSGDLKARLEVNVNLSLFLSRAEERRQDTIAFGRQYDQCADAISRVFKGADVSFVALLEHRKHLLSLEGEENTLLKEAASVEATLATYQSAEQAKRADGERAAAEAKELTAKISSFAKECLARHQQIEMWRQKTITFAETDPDHQLNAVTQAVESTPFQRIHAALCKVLEQPQFTGQQKELVAALGSTCQSVDASVARLRFDITNLATSLIPYLSYYGRQRKELDAYLDLDLEMAYKDVYFKWWNLCSESLRGLVDKQSEEKTDSIVPCSAPSEESVAESTVILRRLSEMHLDPKSLTDGEDDTSSFSRADQLLQDVSNALSTMKLSNAQGQRLMKLAGASWIIKVMEQLNDECCAMNVGSDVPDVLTSTLPASLKYMRVVAVAHACSTLLELVATPKGSMKRLRVSELLIDAQVPDSREERQDTGMNGIIEILQRVGSFAFVVQEEFISNLHARQSHESAGEDLLELIRVIIAAPGGTEDLMNTVLVSSSSSTNDANLSVQQLLAEHPAIHNVFVTAFAVTQKVSLLIDTLQQSLVIAKEEADRMKRFSGAIWIDLVLNFIEQFYGREGGQAMEQVARTIWSAHLNDFLSGCLTKLLQYQLASVISSEWKFDFTAIEPDQDALSDDVEPRILSDRWAIFFSSQMPAIMPSTLVNQSNGTHEIQTRCLSKLLVELMTVCETWWSRHWSKTQANSWAHRISSLRVHHERRLRYAEWLETKSSEDGDPACLSRVQLLAFLSSQVPYLNVLLTDQAAVEASVLELAQQMDYAASTLSVSSAELESADESLHVSIQSCYAKMTGLFDYGRTLVDLVQGISIIETSSGESMPGTEKVELEVDIAGKTFLQAASKTTLEMQSSGETLNEMTTRVQALQDEVKQKRGVYNNLLLRKRDVENVFHSFCLVNKSVVLENARVLSKHVKELRCLMRGFDKLKTPAKQAQLATGSEQRSSLSLERPSSNTTAAFSFMENDRLVRILLRSIRSVNHLQLLESVLERHGEVCVSLREAIAHLDQVLRGFDARFDQLLSDNGHAGINGQESPRAYLLLQLLLDLIEALQVVKTDIPQPRAPNISEVGTREDASASLLVVGRDLLRGCVKLFFEATEMADRLSSTADANRSASEATTLLGEDGEADEESGVADSSADLESGNCAVLAVNSDSGSSSHDTAASTPRSVEEKSQYGLQVLKRIEEKLSGTMAESEHVSQVLTVEQQASWLIDEATKTDNLCVMYEGWTPWI